MRRVAFLLALFVPSLALADDPPASAPGATTPFPASSGGFVARAAPSEDEELAFYGTGGGEFRLRLQALGRVPLAPLPGDSSDELGQNYFENQWIRARIEIGLRPIVRLYAEMDAFRGVLFGDLSSGVESAAFSRTEYVPYPGLTPRKLLVTLDTGVGLFSLGLTTFDWGLGLVHNDGAHEPVFGDYDFGDRVLRAGWSVRPFGRASDLVTSLAGDLVLNDLGANLVDGDQAFVGMLAVAYETERGTIGVNARYRSQRGDERPDEDTLTVDLFGRIEANEPGGDGTIFGETELAYTKGTRRPFGDVRDVDAWVWAARIGRASARYDLVLESGAASGDPSPHDDHDTRGAMDPDHQIGLLLFPELYAWSSARSVDSAIASGLAADPSYPTSGGVAGALYFFPHAILRPLDWLEMRFGAVWAASTTDVVDPYATAARGARQSFRGTSAKNRDLGLELDGMVQASFPLNDAALLSFGVEGGVLFPGHAFDAATSRADPLGMGRVRIGLSF